MPFAHETIPNSTPMIGYAYVPIQQAEAKNLYSPDDGLIYGTIFPILNKPLGVYGKQYNGEKIFEGGSNNE